MNQTLVNPSKKQWFALVLTVIAGCIAPFFQFCHGTLAGQIMEQFSINYTQYGYINTTYAWSCGIGLFIVGAVVEKIGCKGWTMIGIALMICGHAAFYFAPSYAILILSRVVSGFGNACIYNAAYTLAEHWFTGTNKMGVATGGMTAADGIGTFTALYFYAMLIASAGATKGNIIVLVTVTIIFVLLLVFLKDPKIDETVASVAENEDGRYSKVLNSNVIAHSLVVMGVLGGLAVANYYGPMMLQEMGAAESTSGFIASLFAAVGIVSGILFGGISDRMGKRKPTMLGAGIAMVAGWFTMVLATSINSIPLFAFAFIITGFASYIAYPIGFALVTDTIKHAQLGKANGIIQGSSFVIGMFVFQQIVSVVKDVTDSFAIGLAFCAALTILLNVVSVIIFAHDKHVIVAKGLAK